MIFENLEVKKLKKSFDINEKPEEIGVTSDCATHLISKLF